MGDTTRRAKTADKQSKRATNAKESKRVPMVQRGIYFALVDELELSGISEKTLDRLSYDAWILANSS